MSFDSRLANRELTIAVIGLGYVGLPLLVAYGRAGFRCVGIDVDDRRLKALETGTSYIDDVDDASVLALVEAGRLEVTTPGAAIADADVVFVCVPTPFDRFRTPDLSFVRSATETVAQHLRHGQLVILQSTTYPGTTTEILLPALLRSGLQVGHDFFLAFSPERVDPGNVTWTVGNTPKVVGGVDPESTRRAVAVLEMVMSKEGLVHAVSSPAAAEMTKLLENTYRAVNIALVNELAELSHLMGIDVWEVIGAASTKPFGYETFWPGVGPGGHCIPVDPYYLAWKARELDFQTKFIELAADTNIQMAPYVVGRMQEFLNRSARPLRSARVLALGVAFKPRVSDVRNSRAVRVVELLLEAGAEVDYADPMVPELQVGERSLSARDIDTVDISRYDLTAILVGTDWPFQKVLDAGVPIFDAVNATHRLDHPLVERL